LLFISGNVDKESIIKVAGEFKSGSEHVYFINQNLYKTIESKDVVKVSKDGSTIEYNEYNFMF
jgi:hypothetical protein